MNIFQAIAMFLYITSLVVYLYIFTNRFQQGWIKQIKNGKSFPGQTGVIDFRIFSVLSLGLILVILKVLQDTLH